MTRDEIIRMAREAGGSELMRIDGAQDSVIGITGNNAIVRFAALVAAAEREECAQVCGAYIAEGIGREIAAAIRRRGEQ